MRRRDFLAGLLLTATIQPAKAQQPGKVYRIALVHPSAPTTGMSEAGGYPGYPALFRKLRQLGYVEGQNLVVERYSGEGRSEHYAELARDVIRSNPDLVFAVSTFMVRYFKEVTSTIPIVGSMASPVEAGVVASLIRPGGNVTGISVDAGPELLGKRLEVLREAVPKATRVAYLASRTPWEGPGVRILRETAQQTGISLLGPPLDSPIQESEYRRVFAEIAQQRADAVIVGDQPENTAHRQLIVELANTWRLPAIYAYREYATVGGLMVYGVNLSDFFSHAAQDIDQILKGAKPGEIPIYQTAEIELILNLKTAKALGIEIAPTLLARADEVIE